jgi:hypothetical protein
MGFGKFCHQGLAALLDQLPIGLDQGLGLAFCLDEANVTQQFLARLGRTGILAYHIDHLQHVQQDSDIFATAVAQHIEGGVEQFSEGNRIQEEAQPAFPVIEV